MMETTSSPNSSKYNAKTSSDDVMEGFGSQAQGKYIIVTGANCGLGLETARSLAKGGAIVTLACRSKKFGETALELIRREVPSADVSLLLLDLGSFASIRNFVSDYRATNKPLNILINNAAVMTCPKSFTSDGLEMQFGVNHIGHFLLTTELLDILKRSGTENEPSRVVNVSSLGNWAMAAPCGICFDDLKGEKQYSASDRYGAAKLANILFTRELNRRCAADGSHVVSVSLHPGVIYETKLTRYIGIGELWDALTQLIVRPDAFWKIIFNEPSKNIKQGSATTLICALDPNIVPAAHYADCNIDNVYVHAKASDESYQKQLWEVSEEIVK